MDKISVYANRSLGNPSYLLSFGACPALLCAVACSLQRHWKPIRLQYIKVLQAVLRTYCQIKSYSERVKRRSKERRGGVDGLRDHCAYFLSLPLYHRFILTNTSFLFIFQMTGYLLSKATCASQDYDYRSSRNSAEPRDSLSLWNLGFLCQSGIITRWNVRFHLSVGGVAVRDQVVGTMNQAGIIALADTEIQTIWHQVGKQC